MPVTLIEGPPGTGKSFVGVSIARQRLARDSRPVYCNLAVRGCYRFDIEQMAKLPPCTLIVDEAQNWFHSRMWSSMPEDMLERWSQTRHAGWDVFLMTQDANNVDAVVRRILHYGILLEARWASITPYIDSRVRQNARDGAVVARARSLEELDALDLRMCSISADSEEFAYLAGIRDSVVKRIDRIGNREPYRYHRRPLSISGKRWHWRDFKSTKKGVRPVSRQKWRWSWDIADSYNTMADISLRGKAS